MKKSIFLLVIVFAFRLPSDGLAAAAVNACDVVTRAEAEQAAGVNLSEGQLTEFDAVFMRGTTLCHFESLDGKHSRRFVNIELTVAQSAAEAEEKFTEALALINAPEPVQRIGEEAVWGGDISGPKGGLNIRSGNCYLQIKVSLGQEKKNLQQAKILAEKALSRLP